MKSHNLNDLSTEALGLAAQATNKTARYLTNPGLTTLRYDNPPAGMEGYLRYYPGGPDRRRLQSNGLMKPSNFTSR